MPITPHGHGVVHAAHIDFGDAAHAPEFPQPLVLAVLQAPWPFNLLLGYFIASIEFNSVGLLIGMIISDSSSIR
jgi:hypothetical protein